MSSSNGRRRYRDSGTYDQVVADIAGQLRRQRTGPPPSALAVMPVVGFGEQAGEVITASLGMLAVALHATALLLVLVNRPAHRVPDCTLDQVRNWQRRHPEVPLVVADVSLALRPRIGELRQAGLDAVRRAWGDPPAGASLLFVDDDLVSIPTGALRDLVAQLDAAPLAAGPVLFDHPHLPTYLLPDLYAGDLFRALLTDLLLERVEQDVSSASFRTVESLILSGNLAVRADALDMVGGLHDLNELTELTRDVLTASLAATLPPPARSVPLFSASSTEDPVDRLRRSAVRVHSRRALAAYAASGVPTVAQWRSQRLRSSTVDPVRTEPARVVVPPLLASLPARDAAALLGCVERQFGGVLDYLQPDPESALRALEVLGVASRDVDLRPAAGDTGWGVHLRRNGGLLERLAGLQEAELSPRRSLALADATGRVGG